MMCPYRISCTSESQQALNHDLLDKISIALKVASGTMSLSASLPVESHLQHYANYRVMKYAANLLSAVGKNHPVMGKFSNRNREYLKI